MHGGGIGIGIAIENPAQKEGPLTLKEGMRFIRGWFEHLFARLGGLRRFVFLLGASDGEELFGEPTP